MITKYIDATEILEDSVDCAEDTTRPFGLGPLCHLFDIVVVRHDAESPNEPTRYRVVARRPRVA